MSCKCKSPECEECPEWIFTFADLVMLMMGFFVILWVLKPAPNPKAGGGAQAQDDNYIKVAAAIRGAFGYIPDPSSKDPVDVQMLLQKLQSISPAGPGEKGKATRTHQGAQGVEEDVESIRSGKQATMGGRLLFDPGDSSIRPELAQALNEVAELIRGHRTIVLIKGHAALDDFPQPASAQQRMDLSIKRAQTVADYLISKGVSAEVLRVEGCSTFEPIVERAYTTASRAANRRVEVEATATLVDRFRDDAAPQPPLENNKAN
ncbi:MAG: OmpA family protein [Phycisphaerae bacterium]|nr:OmpA family protein [Phycisphaerae bacterium]